MENAEEGKMQWRERRPPPTLAQYMNANDIENYRKVIAKSYSGPSSLPMKVEDITWKYVRYEISPEIRIDYTPEEFGQLSENEKGYVIAERKRVAEESCKYLYVQYYMKVRSLRDNSSEIMDRPIQKLVILTPPEVRARYLQDLENKLKNNPLAIEI